MRAKQAGKIVYLNGWPPDVRDVRAFLPELVDRLVIVCEVGLEAGFKAQGLTVAAVKRFSFKEMDRVAALLKERFKVDAVIADSEAHVLAAAYLRSMFGLSGQNLRSARAYRNKALMYDYLNGSTTFRLPKTMSKFDPSAVNAVFGGVERIIVKPALGPASEGVSLVARSDKRALARVAGPNTVLQEFIPYPIFHADGLIRAGDIWFLSVSRCSNTWYRYACGDFVVSEFVTDAGLLDRFRIALKEVFVKMPTPWNSTFHVEAFYDAKSDDLVFCEAASRTGGAFGAILKTNEFTFGVNLTRELFLLETLKDYEPTKGRRRGDGVVSAYAMIPNVYESKLDPKILKEPWAVYSNYAPAEKDDRRLSLVYSIGATESAVDFARRLLTRISWEPREKPLRVA